jgi:hypothetical protein
MVPLERNGTTKSSRRLHINDIGRGIDSLGPEMRWKRRKGNHRTSSLKKMTMLTLSHVILSMHTMTRELSEGTLLSKNTTQNSRKCTHQQSRHGTHE